MGLGRAYESQVLIPSVAQRCIGQVRDGGVFLFASEPRLCNGVHPAVLSLGDAHEQAVQVLTSFQHQHSLATGVIGQVGAEKIDWFKEDGTRLCDDVVAGFVFDAVRSVRGLCHTVIVGEALGEALRAVAIVEPKNPSYLLLGPLWGLRRR